MITVIGEALIDLLPTPDATMLRALPGGSALNTAVGVARLGRPAALVAHLSRDRFGQLLRRYAVRNGVDVSGAPEADEPTAIAMAPAGIGGNVRACLYASGAATWRWTSSELAWIPADTTVLQIGSLAWSVPSSAAAVLRVAKRLRQRGALVSMDLTVHPEVLRTPGQGRIVLERPLRAADVVRADVEDIAWLYPGRTPQAVCEQWLGLGPELVVVTSATGAMAFRGPGSVLHRSGYPADVADATGGHDAFTAALLIALHDHNWKAAGSYPLSAVSLSQVLDLAILVAGMTRERPGADPPTALEVKDRCHRLAVYETLTDSPEYFWFVNPDELTVLLIPAEEREE